MTPEWVKTAKVGDQVVFFKAGSGDYLWATYPELGATYTIRGMYEYDNEIILLLRGIRNPTSYIGKECGFEASHFPPVHKSSTDKGMEVLKKLLHPAPHELETAE